MYKIGDFSKLCRMSVKTLRYYDDLGIFKPDFIDKYSGYRYYSAAKLTQAYKILGLKELGFSLDEIKDYLSRGCQKEISNLLFEKTQNLKHELNVLQSRISKLDLLSKALSQEGDFMSGNIIVKQNGTLKIASIRALIKDRNEIQKTLDYIKTFLNESNVRYNDLSVVINYDTEYCAENMDLEVGVQITTPLPLNDIIKEKLISKDSKTASIICSNTEEDIQKAYISLLQYNENNGYQTVGAFYEYYHDKNTVELQVPVHKLFDARLVEPRNDNINTLFENDEEVIGRWEFVDLVPTEEHFCYQKYKFTGTKQFNELFFLPKGEQYWCYSWTKNYLIASYGDSQGLNRYNIRTIDGQMYMFVEFKTGEYYFYGGMPEILVLRKTDDKHYKKDEIRKYDRTDYPFMPDDNVLGKWIAIDLVQEIEDFSPHQRIFQGDLFFRYAYFKEKGEYEIQFGVKTYSSPAFTWTKGLALAHNMKTTSEYTIKRIMGTEFLFIALKSGDYYYAGRKPWYYVFKRDE